MSDQPRLFLVQRRPWRSYHWFSDDYYEEQGGLPLRAFADAESAEAYRQQLEAAARRRLSPFQFIEKPWAWENEAGVTLADILSRFGVPIPTGQEKLPGDVYDRNRHWWDSVADTLTPEQRHALWEPFDEFPFYKVVEVDLED